MLWDRAQEPLRGKVLEMRGGKPCRPLASGLSPRRAVGLHWALSVQMAGADSLCFLAQS